MKFLFFLLAIAASAANLVDNVRESIARADLPRAAEMIRAYRASKGVTPETVEALSWMARGELAQKNLVQADKYAQETYKLSLEQLKTHPLAHDANLQIALGSAIEVEATVLTTRGQRAEAIAYLEDQLKTYYATPLRPRIQKNLNVLSLEGKRAPALEHVAIPAGKPVLLEPIVVQHRRARLVDRPAHHGCEQEAVGPLGMARTDMAEAVDPALMEQDTVGGGQFIDDGSEFRHIFRSPQTRTRDRTCDGNRSSGVSKRWQTPCS